MHYMLTPLHTHIDSGFGATANAFTEAADTLESSVSDKGDLLNEFLPINYLRRHAIELFLKSAIVIIHRTLTLPYKDTPADGAPKALVDGTWIPFQRLHSVKALWIYLQLLFQEQKEFFDSVKTVNWTFPPDLDDWISMIEERDPRSTFFRYPTIGDRQRDADKATMSEIQPADIPGLWDADPSKKHFMLLMKDEKGEVTQAYYHSGDALGEFTEVLKACTEEFYGTHAALRSEVCGGN